MSYSLSLMQPPRKSFSGSSIAYTSGVWNCISREGQPCICHAAELVQGGTDGVLRVHLVNDPAGVYYDLPLEAGYRNSAEFDQVIETGTTVTESEITLFVLVQSF